MAITFKDTGGTTHLNIDEEQRKLAELQYRRGARGSFGSPTKQYVNEYNSRVRTDSGMTEALNCLMAKIDSLWKT